MTKLTSKPSPEAKALSLFLMAYKTTNPIYKEKSKRINKRWDLVLKDEITRPEYNEEVLEMITSYGGYDEVVEKTVKFYIEKTGEWTLKGNDKYCQDAQLVADKLLKK
jgi:hypothetical protein